MDKQATSQGGTAVAEVASNEAELNALLGGAAPESSTAEVEAEEPAVETETEDAQSSGEDHSTEEVEAEDATEEEAETEAEEEAEEEESELSLTESDRDYSDAAYKKAAAHYSRTHKVQLNPEDPTHRALLKEIMDRGEALKRQQAEREKTETKADDEKGKVEEEATEKAPANPTPEQIQAFIKNAGEFAKTRVVPEVAMHVFTRFTKALWPDEDLKPTQEQATQFVEALTEFLYMGLDDALPFIGGAVRNGLSNDAVFGRVETMAVREAAFEQLDQAVDKTTGKPLYPGLEEMANSGSLKRAVDANPWIKNIVVGNGRNKVANFEAQMSAAYKIARGERVNPETVRQAVETGKKQATDREKKIASGRVAPGKTKGEIGKQPSASEQLVSELTSGGGSRFSAALAKDGRVVKRSGQ